MGNNSTVKTQNELIDELAGQKLLTSEEATKLKAGEEVKIGSKTFSFGQTLLSMFEKAEEDGCEGGSSCTNPDEHLHIGDYVDYNPGTTGTYTSYAEQTGMDYDSDIPDEVKTQVFNVNNSTTWRVLGTEGTGSSKHIVLISGSPIKKESTTNDPYYYLYGARGHINFETELKNICAIYGNGTGATGARSVNVDDVNTACGITVGSTGLTPDVDFSGSFGQTCSYTNQYASPEDYLNGITSNFSKTSNAYYYSVIAKSSITESNIKNMSKKYASTNNIKVAFSRGFPVVVSDRTYDLLIKDTDTKFYWLASRSVDVYSNCANFCEGSVDNGYVDMSNSLFYSYGDEYFVSLAVRPVVSLESGVTKDTINILPDQKEEPWSGRDIEWGEDS